MTNHRHTDNGNPDERKNYEHAHQHDHQLDHHRHEYESGHTHSAHSHSHAHSHAPDNKKGLFIALLITGSIMLLEFFGGLVTDSLALLSDSGHMLGDTFSLALSLVAMIFALKPPSPDKTYGLLRLEIMAALFNGVTLFIIAGFIIWEACQRFSSPPEVASGTMMLIASVGLLANLISAWSLMRKSNAKENINIRSAYLHIMSDALGSIGALLAGLIMKIFNWYTADPIISVIVALLILKGAWSVMKQAFHVLMEGTPPGVNVVDVRQALLVIDGVIDVHDLHVWTITSGLHALSAHLVIHDSVDQQIVLQEAVSLAEKNFGIQHATLQVESSSLLHGSLSI